MSQVKHRFAARMDGIAPFHAMAILAQALEAAGCILSLCRLQPFHVRQSCVCEPTAGPYRYRCNARTRFWLTSASRHIRFAYTQPLRRLTEAITRLDRFLQA